MKQLIFVALGAVGLLVGSCGHGDDEHEKEKVDFTVTSPLVTDTVLVDEYVCQIHAIRHIELRAQERGYLQNIYIDEGDYVQEGQLLFRIMPTLYQAERQSAEAEAELARIEYLNTKQLADSNVVAPNELAMAKARYDKAKAELALADAHLSFTEIRAPFSGLIDRFHVRLGSLVEEGDLLTNLSDNSELWVYFNVPEAEYLNFMSNDRRETQQKVKLRMANNELFDEIGVVETIEADFDNETGNIPFRATFDNPEALLRHGETGNILMSVPVKDALLIPQKATFEILDKRYVYVLDEEDRVKSRQITISEAMEDLFVVTDGLAPEDKILLEGLRKVKDGQEISYSYEEPREVAANLKVHAE